MNSRRRTPTAAGRRLSSQVRAVQATKKDDNGRRVEEVSVNFRAVFAVVAILFMTGFIGASIYIERHRPGCSLLRGEKSATTSSTAATETALLQQKVVEPEPSSTSHQVAQIDSSTVQKTTLFQKPLSVKFEDGAPATCTAEQLQAVSRQLSPAQCDGSVGAFTQSCSFTKATKGCQSPEIMRRFYVHDNTETPFQAVLIGYEQDDAPFDTLYVGSRRNKKYHWSTGSSEKSCREALSNHGIAPPLRDAKVLVVEWNQERYERLLLTRQRLRMTDGELVLDKTNFEGPQPEEMLPKIVQDKLMLSTIPADQQPIHYFQISGNDMDYILLTKQMKGLLKQIRYLVFEYTWKPSWRGDNIHLSDVIQNLKQNGLVCYWAGDKDADFALWRITDCWQDYYDFKTWSHIACVNTLHGDVKDLAIQMERKFLDTLQKDIVY